MSKDLTFQEAQRHAFKTLKDNENFKVKPEQINTNSMLIQEQPLTTAKSILTFNFGSNAPKPSAVLNNIVLGENDVACGYAWQLLLGYGANVNTRQYYSYGLSVADNVLYNSVMTGKFETNELIPNVDTNIFREEKGTVQEQYQGAALHNPQRLFTGRNSRVDLVINLGEISTLAFTPNLFISVRWWIALGSSSATN